MNKEEESKIENEQIKRIEFGNMARNFLQSKEWTDLVKPIINSMIKGVDSVRGIKRGDSNSEIKAQSLILAHQMTADYLEEIETLIEGFVVDGDNILSILEKKKNRKNIYKSIE